MRLASLILDRFGVSAQLIAGKGGVFDVVVDGKRVFSKHEVGTFPDEDDLLTDLAGI